MLPCSVAQGSTVAFYRMLSNFDSSVYHLKDPGVHFRALGGLVGMLFAAPVHFAALREGASVAHVTSFMALKRVPCWLSAAVSACSSLFGPCWCL